MFRASLRPLRKEIHRIQRHTTKRNQRSYTTPPYPNPRLRIVGPTLWCLGTASTVFIGCASWEVYHDAQDLKRRRSSLYGQDAGAPSWWTGRGSPSISTDTLLGKWQSLNETDKAISGAIGLNAGIFAVSRILPALQWQFSHLPAGPFNYTLLTSLFGHSGLFHLGANMYGLYNFAPKIAQTREFNESGAHLTAFYLSAGIFANLAHHLTSKWASPRALHSTFMVPSLGASGAIFAILGSYAMLFPQAQIGLLFIPGSIPADQALAGIALFETYGLAVGFRSINFGHAAHLAGLALGVGYVHFDGNRRLWQPTRRFVRDRMKQLGVL